MTKNHIPFGESMFWALMFVLVLIFPPQKVDTACNIDHIIDQSNTEESICESIPFVEESSIKMEESIADIESTVSEESIIEPEVSIPPVEVHEKEPRYGFTEDDIYLLTVLLCGSENRDGDGEYDFDFENQDNYEQISLVLCVVMNRVNSDIFPDSIEEVIWQKRQFSPMKLWQNGLPKVNENSLEIVRNWCTLYDNYDPKAQTIPEEHLYFSGTNCINISRKDYK